MSAGQLSTTPWVRAELARLAIDRDDLAASIPDGCLLALSGGGPRGPWQVRGYRDGREVTPFDSFNKSRSPDLGHAIAYALRLLEGVGSGS